MTGISTLSTDGIGSMATCNFFVYKALIDIARREQIAVDEILALIEERRTMAVAAGTVTPSSASAVRVFVTAYYRRSCPPGVSIHALRARGAD